MSNSRPQDESAQPMNEAEMHALTYYPRGKRIAAGTVKSTVAILFGVSAALSFVFAPAIPIWLMATAGVVFVTALTKAARSAYKANKEEERLSKRMKARIAETKGEIEAFLLADIEDKQGERVSVLKKIYALLKADKWDNDRESLEALDLRFSQLNVAVREIFPAKEKEEEKVLIKNINTAAKTKLLSLDRTHPKKAPRYKGEEPEEDISPKKAPDTVLGKAWVFTKKLGNRWHSMANGVATGMSIALGITTIVFGISNPVGWVMGGIVGAALVMGLVAVAVDYLISRPQELKVERLKEKVHQYDKIRDGLKTFGQHLKDKLELNKYEDSKAKDDAAKREALEARQANTQRVAQGGGLAASAHPALTPSNVLALPAATPPTLRDQSIHQQSKQDRSRKKKQKPKEKQSSTLFQPPAKQGKNQESRSSNAGKKRSK